MPDRDPNIVYSGLSGPFAAEGITVRVEIYRLEGEPQWALEVIDASGASTVWDDRFDTDDVALAEFRRTVSEEGMSVFLDRGNVVSFRRQ